MNLNNDISQIIQSWAYDAHAVTARLITSEDGMGKIQLRLDLGIFQMNLTGRPDGSQPRGHESLLHFYRQLATTSTGNSFLLDEQACTELQQEAVQYYYRYLARFALEDYAGVIRDTQHNIDILDLVANNTDNQELIWEFIQFKPYVTMMRTRARAELLAADDDVEGAEEAVRNGLDTIRAFWQEQGDDFFKSDSYEIDLLNELLQKFQEQRPNTEIGLLREQLAYAISVENYEHAAKLRDQLQVVESLELEPATNS